MSNIDEQIEAVKNLNLKTNLFNSWSFKLTTDTIVFIHTIKYSPNYLYIWLSNNGKLENLSFAIQTNYEKLPLGINILNKDGDNQQFIDNLTRKLSFKLNKQVLLALNIDSAGNNEFYLNIEKCLLKEINLNKEKF
jgi:hypothetical protein